MRLSLVLSSLAVMVLVPTLAPPPFAVGASTAGGTGGEPLPARVAAVPAVVALVPFEDQSGTGVPLALSEWLARGLQQRLAALDPTLVPRVVLPPATGASRTLPGLAAIGREAGAVWVVRGGVLGVTSGADPSRVATNVSLHAELVHVGTGVLRGVRAEGRDAKRAGGHPWGAFDASPDAFRHSPIGRATEKALDALAVAVRTPIAIGASVTDDDSGLEPAAEGASSDGPGVEGDANGEGLIGSEDAVEDGAVEPASDPAEAEGEDLQQLLSGAEAALEADGGAHPDAVRAVEQALDALRSALVQDAERLEQGEDPDTGASAREARRADLERAVGQLVDAGASGEPAEEAPADGAAAGRVDPIGRADAFVQEALELVLRIQELRAAFRGFDEQRVPGGGLTGLEGDAGLPGGSRESGAGAAEDAESFPEPEGESEQEAGGGSSRGAGAGSSRDAVGEESWEDADLGRIGGVVLEDGRPVPGAEVTEEASGSRAVTDANGRFALENLPVGTMATLRLLRSGRTIATGRVDVPRARVGVADFDVGARSARSAAGTAGTAGSSALRVLPANVVVGSRAARLGGSSTVRGVVRDPRGKPIARALVRIGDIATARTDSRGTFGFLRVPAGPHRLVVDAPEMKPHAEAIRAVAGGSRRVSIRLSPLPASRRVVRAKTSIVTATAARLSGRVRDTRGRPIAAARVSVIPAAGAGRAAGQRTDHGGRYRFARLSPGAYRLVVVRAGYSTGHEDVTVAAREDKKRDVVMKAADTPASRALAARAKRVARRDSPPRVVTLRTSHGPGAEKGVSAGADLAERGSARRTSGRAAIAKRRIAGGEDRSHLAQRVSKSKGASAAPARAAAGRSTRRGRDGERSDPAARRDLGSGLRCDVTGVAADSRSRALEGTITVSRGGSTIGQARTTGGRFSLFDLGPGRYVLRFTAVGGGHVATRTVTVANGPVTHVRLIVAR